VCIERTVDCEWYNCRDNRDNGLGLTSYSLVCVESLTKTTNSKEKSNLRDRESNPVP